MDSSEYEGFSSRETWAMNLWLMNNEVWEAEVGKLVEAHRFFCDIAIGEVLEAWWQNVAAIPDDESIELAGWARNIYPTLADVGSDYRIYWSEIAAGWAAGLDRHCWHVGSNTPGYMPDSTAECLATLEEAKDWMAEELDRWLEETASSVFEMPESSTRLGEEVYVITTSGERRVFFANRVEHGECDHEECSHEGLG